MPSGKAGSLDAKSYDGQSVLRGFYVELRSKMASIVNRKVTAEKIYPFNLMATRASGRQGRQTEVSRES